jgi:thiol:disulfide interchange protein DsbD
MNVFARFAFMTLFAIHAAAAEKEALVRASLEASVDNVAAGGEFVLGVRFAVEPGWHVYWRNPGDSGLPLKATLRLPDGLIAGDWQWPTPRRFDQAGMVAFGYCDEVVLTTTVTAAEKKDLPNPLVIDAKLSWLACKEACVPGSQAVKLTLPLGDGAKSLHADDLRAWQERSPRSPATEQLSVKRADVAEAGNSRGTVTAEMTGTLAGAVTTFIPESSDAFLIDYAAMTVSGGRISFPMALLQALPDRVDGIAVTGDQPTGWQIRIPLTAP